MEVNSVDWCNVLTTHLRMELNTHYVCTLVQRFSQHRHDSLQKNQKTTCFYKEGAIKQIKIIINNTDDILNKYM